MYSPEFFINTVQNAKKQWTNTILTDPKLNKAAMKFIDSQTAFAEMLVKNTEEVTKYFIDTQTNYWFPNTKA